MALSKINSRRHLLLIIHLPWCAAEIFQYHASLSYFIAWAGSFLLFYWTLFSPFRFLSADRPRAQQIMRPIVLIQLVFAGFMCCSSIFYVVDQLNNAYDPPIELLSKCQRLSLLAHTALLTGIILLTKTQPAVHYQNTKQGGNLWIVLSLAAFTAAKLTDLSPVIIQFKYNLLCLTIFSAAYILILGLVKKNLKYLTFGSIAFGINLVGSTLSGYKETMIINFIILAFLAFPYYKKTVLLLAPPCIYLLLYILPTLTTIIRLQTWKGNKSAEMSRSLAWQTLSSGDDSNEIKLSNWEFMTNRLSEINMFSKFIAHVPQYHSYYGLKILMDSFYALIPRAFWKEKPITEQLAMERVYEAGVAERTSSISAKSRPVVDGYLSAGIPGVYLSIFIYGLLTQWCCNTAEKWFGGYEPGCMLIFNSIFQQLWRGNNFEFLLNNMVYSFVLMSLLFLILRKTKILIPL